LSRNDYECIKNGGAFKNAPPNKECIVMNITNGAHPTNNSYKGITNANKASDKTGNANYNAVTAEDIVARIWALGTGIAAVTLDECDSRSSRLSCPGLHINISPSILQRLIDDPAYRESQFDIIRRNLEVIADPRILEAQIAAAGPGPTGNPLDIIGIQAFSMLMHPVNNGARAFSLSDFIIMDDEAVEELEGDYAEAAQEHEQGNTLNLQQAMFQQLASQFALKRDLLTKQHEAL